MKRENVFENKKITFCFIKLEGMQKQTNTSDNNGMQATQVS